MFRSGVARFRAFAIFLLGAAVPAFLPAPASAQTIDSYILIQPIIVCDDNGNNCAQFVAFPEELKKIYAQAGIFPVLLPFNQLNDTSLQSVSGISDIDGSGGMSADPLTINAWFVLNLPTGDPNSVLYGEAWVDANGLVINSTAVASFNGGIGRLDTFAHELGHNLGLGHDDFGAGGANNLMTAGSSRTVPGTINDITPDGQMLSVLTQDQIDEILASPFVQLAMDCLGDANNNVITRTFAEVCLNLRGLEGDDILTLTGGVVLGDMTGDAGNDILTVGDGSTVLGNVDGGSGNDLISIGANGDPANVLGGTGSDLIALLTGSLVTGSVYGDDNDGDESDDGGDLIVMLGGTVGGNVDGEGGDDVIRILGGSVAGHVLGGGGDDVIETAEPATITGNVDGEAGNDTITIASDPADVLGGTGDDVITLNSGAVVVNVFGDDNDGNEGDDGADVIVMNGGTVSGNIDAEGGDDVISLNGGSVGGGVLGGGGADLFNLSGGSVTGSVNGEGGDDFFSFTAGTIGGSLLGGSGADKFLLSGGTVNGNVNAGTGNDEILLTGSTVNGEVEGDDGADLIIMTAGSAGDIFGGLGDDLIQVLGGTVTGTVSGEGGNDVIVTAEPGTVNGNVDGGSGNDIITIASDPADVLGGTGDDVINIVAGAFVDGSVYGDDNDGNEADDGNDTINLSGGVIVNSVFGEGGDDFIILSGTTIGGSILGNGGHDGILITGGLVTSVFGGAGNDAAVWTGGTIATSFDMGTGSDSLDIYGINAGGSALQAGLVVLDGGDDASGADGQLDVLNLHGVVEVLTELQNWEFINLLDTSRGDLGTASRTIDTEEFFIEAGSILFASGAASGTSYVIDGDLLNAGVIDMANGVPTYDSFTVTGLYTGHPGSQFHTDTFLGGVGSPSDLLIVGDETEGQTALFVFDTNPGPGAYNPVGIPIVDVSTGTTAADHFVLVNGFTGFAGPIDKGLFFYDLALRPDNVHVLIGVPDLEAFQLGRIPGQAQSAWHRTAGVWLDRTADLRVYLDGSAAPGSRGPVSPGFWLRGVGSMLDREESVTFTLFNKSYDWNLSYDQNTYGAFAGGDWAWNVGQGGSGVLGVFVGYTGWDSQFDQQSANGGYSTVEANGVSFGLYTTYVNSGFFLDGVFKADLPEIEMNFPGLEPVGPSAATTDATSLGGVLDAGYRHKFGFNWYVEGLGTLSYVDTEIDPVDLAGSIIGFGDDQSFRGRLGLGLGGTYKAGEVFTLVHRLSLSVWQEFDGRNGTDIVSPGGAPLDIRDDLSGTYGEVSALVDLYSNQSGFSFFLKSDYRFGEDTSEFAGSLGLRYQ